MLKYIKSYLIDKKIYFIFVVVFFTKNLYAENIIARYEVTWNNVSLGNITWWYKIVDSNYEFLIKTEDAGFLSKVYKFSGENISRGIFNRLRRGNVRLKALTLSFPTHISASQTVQYCVRYGGQTDRHFSTTNQYF